MKKLWASTFLAVVILLLALGTRAQMVFNTKASIVNSRHDFRASSTTAIKSSGGNDPCVFCHTPHNATPGPELWNHKMSTTSFPSYGSSTMLSTVGVISDLDSSKLCLSCHDGTIALASTINNGDIEFTQGPNYMLPATSTSNLAGYGGKGFADDHPFAFTPNLQNPEITQPPLGDPVRFETGKVQCVSCHDPHVENIDTTQGKFLVKSNQASGLCVSCHRKTGWTGSAHQAPPDPLQDQKYTATQGAHTGYVGVANNGCESCHRPHGAGVSQRLVKFAEENTCYACHDGSVTTLNIKADLTTKTYRHPVEITPSVHDAAEGPPTSVSPMPEISASAPRHAECEDCHNPHRAQPNIAGSQPVPPGITPPLAGASGSSTAKVFLPQAANQYEICFKCHADSANRPQLTATGNAGIGFGRYPQRQFDLGNPDAFNTRVEFTAGTSFHPVTRTNPAASSQSLRPYMIAADGTNITTRPLTATSMIYCSDCHASDTNRTLAAGNIGPAGPHGSNNQHLLERQNVLENPPATPGSSGSSVSYSLTNYALCNKCHDVQNVVYQGADGFSRHGMHINMTACSTCHDPHASQSPHLVNFDRSIVAPNSAGVLSYTQTSTGHGTCSLRCHGEDHSNDSY